MRWSLPFLLLLALAAVPASAQKFKVETPHVDRIDIFEHGIYQSLNSQKIKDPSAPGGERGTVVNIDLVRSTDIIPADLEMEFGIRYELIGGPKDTPVPTTLVIRFPQPGLKEPGKPKPLLEYRSTVWSNIGTTDNYQSYGFDYPWEIVPGVWTFEIWCNGKKMAEHKFNVVD